MVSFAAMGSATQRTEHASEQEREDVAAKCEAWFALQPDLDPSKLVLLDGELRCAIGPSDNGERGHYEDGVPARTQPPRGTLSGQRSSRVTGRRQR